MNKLRERAKEYNKNEHRLIWIKHHGQIPKNCLIHHINGIKTDNRIENLECLTIKQHGLKHQLPNRIRITYPSGAVCVKKVLDIKLNEHRE